MLQFASTVGTETKPPDPLPRVVFMGTPEYAVTVLSALLSKANVLAVYTQPDRPAGRGRASRPSPVAAMARENGIAVSTPRSLKRDTDAVQRLADLHPDLVVVAAYGLLLPREALAAPTRGCLNVHASLLPRWRGASPVHHAIAAGDALTGCSIMLMDEGLDTGPVLTSASTPIAAEETTGTLTARLAELGAELLLRTLPEWLADRLHPTAQDGRQATFAPQLSAADGRMDWGRTAEGLALHVRAMNPWPGAFTLLPDGRRLKILAGTAVDVRGEVVGTILSLDGDAAVACGSGVLRLDTVQPAGGKLMAGGAFLRGHRDIEGARMDAGATTGTVQ